MSKTSTPTKILRNHPMWHQADYDYLSKKGYTNKEIKAFWDRDHAQGCTPVTHEKSVFDLVGYLTGSMK